MDSGTFHFFAYDECMRTETLTAAAGVAPTAAPTPAILEGFALRFSAISCASPRIGLPNLTPVSEATVDADEASRAVFGVVFTLPTSARSALLHHMAQKGSYNVVSDDVEVRLLGPGAHSTGAIKVTAVAALDLAWLKVVKAVAETFVQPWAPLPLPQAHDGHPGKGGSRRWPGYHWCNCIATKRTAPTTEMLGTIQNCFATHVKGVLTSEASDVSASMAQYEAMLRTHVVTRSVETDPEEARTWYFAYGSNMSWEQLCVRIGPPYQRRAVRMPNYVLIANKMPADPTATFGYYNIEPLAERQRKASAGLTKGPDHMPDYVCGAAYEISNAQLALMDGYEWGYTRQWLACEDISHDLGLSGADTGAAFACGAQGPDASTALTAAWAYIATETSEKLMPSVEYLSRVLEGEDAIPRDYAEAIRTTPTNAQRSPRQEKRIRKEL